MIISTLKSPPGLAANLQSEDLLSGNSVSTGELDPPLVVLSLGCSRSNPLEGLSRVPPAGTQVHLAWDAALLWDFLSPPSPSQDVPIHR